GAIIRMRSPARDRKSLFDIAVAGPLAGLAIAIPTAIFGLAWSNVAPANGHFTVFGESLLWSLLVHLKFVAILTGMLVYTHPLADPTPLSPGRRLTGILALVLLVRLGPAIPIG